MAKGEMSGVYEYDKVRASERLDAEREKRERQAEERKLRALGLKLRQRAAEKASLPMAKRSVQEWGPGPGQRTVPCCVARACDETKAARDAYDRARDQAAQAGHPDPHGAALVVLLDAKLGST